MFYSGRQGTRTDVPYDYSGYLLVFNKPDLASQSNLIAQQMFDRYKTSY